MIVFGSTSEVAQAFVEKVLYEGETFPKIYLLTSNFASTKRFADHIEAKFQQQSEIVELDLLKDIDYSLLQPISSSLLFCATGYLGKSTEEGLFDDQNTMKIVDVNYAKLILYLTFFAKKMEESRSGTIIALTSVAGERGRQSNFIYGSAKAGFTAYLSGLRNYLFDKKVLVLTVKPGFMDTKMTEGLPLNPKLTASPKKAADVIYTAYKKRKNTIYVLPIWRPIMYIIKSIPEFIFKKLKL